MAAPIGSCARPEDVVDVTSVPSAAGGARVAIRRRLVEQPVMSVIDLTEEQQGWWRRNREREREWFQQKLGLDLELRAEGAIAIDPSGDLSDLTFPAAGSAKHFALLLVAELVDMLRAEERAELDGIAWARLAASTVRQAGDRVFAAWRRGLRKDHRENPDAVFDEALGILSAVGLLRRDDGAVLIHAAAARFAPRAELLAAAGPSGQRSLFEEDS